MSIPLNKSPTPHYQPSVSTKILTIAKAGTLHFANFIADAVQKQCFVLQNKGCSCAVVQKFVGVLIY